MNKRKSNRKWNFWVEENERKKIVFSCDSTEDFLLLLLVFFSWWNAEFSTFNLVYFSLDCDSGGAWKDDEAEAPKGSWKDGKSDAVFVALIMFY